MEPGLPTSKREAKNKRMKEFQAELSNEIWRFLQVPNANLMKIRAKDRRVGMTQGLAEFLSFVILNGLLPVSCKIRVVTNTSRSHSCSNHEEPFIKQLLRPELGMDQLPHKTPLFKHKESRLEIEVWSFMDLRTVYTDRQGSRTVDLCIVDDYSSFKKEYLDFLKRFSHRIVIAKTGVEYSPLDVDIELIENRRIQRDPIAYTMPFPELSSAVLETVE